MRVGHRGNAARRSWRVSGASRPPNSRHSCRQSHVARRGGRSELRIVVTSLSAGASRDFCAAATGLPLQSPRWRGGWTGSGGQWWSAVGGCRKEPSLSFSLRLWQEAPSVGTGRKLRFCCEASYTARHSPPSRPLATCWI